MHVSEVSHARVKDPSEVLKVGQEIEVKIVKIDDLGGPGVHGLVRMTYTGNPDGSVRQYGEGSTDHGKTWQSSFDLIYRPKEDAK